MQSILAFALGVALTLLTSFGRPWAPEDEVQVAPFAEGTQVSDVTLFGTEVAEYEGEILKVLRVSGNWVLFQKAGGGKQWVNTFWIATTRERS